MGINPVSIDGSEGPMGDLLDAFQYLQGENLAATSSLADQSQLSAIELRMLLIIRRMPAVSTTTVAGMIHHSIKSCTAIVNRLAMNGYLERQPPLVGGGGPQLHLTGEGKALTEGIRDFYRTAFTRAVPEADLAALAMEVRDLADAIRAKRMQFEEQS
ncbi:MAG: MarR family winged helix-turn-helix transcriptional regulator [Actinomycetota bacterium]|nr:MarR family winged helix-turn-helix transcriptional regulator [Actinomycetota bacterium]